MGHAFTNHYDSPTLREENSKLLSTLSVQEVSKEGDDEYAALKLLMQRIELIAPVAARRVRS